MRVKIGAKNVSLQYVENGKGSPQHENEVKKIYQPAPPKGQVNGEGEIIISKAKI